MSHPDNFQDWTTVVLKNNRKSIQNRNAITEVQKRSNGNQGPKESNIEAPQQMVTTNLKQKIINTRGALKLNQEKLATAINVKPQELKLLESGKMSHKDAKQIAKLIIRDVESFKMNQQSTKDA